MENKKPIITIDGPAASGKGAVSKNIAQELSLFHLETGLFYRSLALEYIAKNSKNIDLDIFLNSLQNKNFFVKNIEKIEIYGDLVTRTASLLAKKKKVRDFIVRMQKIFIKKYLEKYKGLILDGRDCGTVIAPQAEVKVFLTAKLDVRAKRRFKQINEKNLQILYKDILEDIAKRDERDTKRNHSPLIKAEDSIVVDSSEKNLLETINIVKKIIFSKLPYLEKN